MDWKDVLGQLREDPSLPEGEDIQQADPEKRRQTDTLRVVVDRKGRKGKVATIVEGFTIPDERVAEIASMLKRQLGVGGSARGGEILIQGNCADRVRQFLLQNDFKIK